MAEWYRRLVEVPGVHYVGDPRVNRAELPGSNAVLKSHTVTMIGGERLESHRWDINGIETAEAPAHRYAFEPVPIEEPTEAILERVRAALELPGLARDYHFVILRCIEALWTWQRRRSDPSVAAHIEELCWLDVRLVEAQPDAIVYARDGERGYFDVPAFRHLIALYEREGFVREALDVADRAATFNLCGVEREHLQRRMAALEAEDADALTR